VAETRSGAPGIVDLWYWMYEPIDETALAEAWCDRIAVDERERYERFRFERDRRLFLATRALVRTVLSRYAPVAPGEWRFVADGAGKPRIAGPQIFPDLHFNLANTPGLVACVVSAAHDAVGVDVERIDRTLDFVALANRYFAAQESRQLRNAGSFTLARQFFTYWTLKESYVKARGLGLSLPLDAFWFAIGDAAVRIEFDAKAADVESAWRFASIDVRPLHLLAVAARTNGAGLSLRAAHLASEHALA